MKQQGGVILSPSLLTDFISLHPVLRTTHTLPPLCTGCMSLETISATLWALNRLPKPPYESRFYPNLVCSLSLAKCEWTYSPLDTLRELRSATSIPCDEVTPTKQASIADVSSRDYCQWLKMRDWMSVNLITAMRRPAILLQPGQRRSETKL